MSAYSLTEHEQCCLDHLQRARTLGLSLREYADSQGLTVGSLYQTKSQLKKKGALDEPTEGGGEDEAFVAVSVVPSAAGTVLRLRHPGGWEMACETWPPVDWLLAVLSGGDDAAR
jgi:hypothetical protein